MEGGSLTGDFEGKVWKEAVEMGVSLLRGLLGNLWSPLTGNIERQLEGSVKRASLFAEALLGGLLLRVWKNIEKRAQEMDMTISPGNFER
jgi:hypothetical protein